MLTRSPARSPGPWPDPQRGRPQAHRATGSTHHGPFGS